MALRKDELIHETRKEMMGLDKFKYIDKVEFCLRKV